VCGFLAVAGRRDYIYRYNICEAANNQYHYHSTVIIQILSKKLVCRKIFGILFASV